jgi:hypothetical protein
VLSGAMVSMSSLLEKLGPQRYFTRVRGRSQRVEKLLNATLEPG